ncbi:zinc ribbon domain-containing protein [Streptomyces rimosus]|uniref:zinc ribbon domain-containing protein n=1 Tax=Streptomyces rimosus TaxID=1927 RepID=UPI00131D34CD|nr:zinc ribbon domain-containing protein [Streptomyces rimosus]
MPTSVCRRNRAILDSPPGELRRQITYKTSWYGSRLAVLDRMWPPSKTCSACGWRNPGHTLADRVCTCTTCGLTLDRDFNAARNIARHAQPVAPGREKTAAHNSGPAQQAPVEGTQVPPPTGAEGRSQRNGRARPRPGHPGGAMLRSPTHRAAPPPHGCVPLKPLLPLSVWS